MYGHLHVDSPSSDEQRGLWNMVICVLRCVCNILLTIGIFFVWWWCPVLWFEPFCATATLSSSDIRYGIFVCKDTYTRVVVFFFLQQQWSSCDDMMVSAICWPKPVYVALYNENPFLCARTSFDLYFVGIVVSAQRRYCDGNVCSAFGIQAVCGCAHINHVGIFVEKCV